MQVVVNEVNFRQLEHVAQTTRLESRWLKKTKSDALETLDPIHTARYDYDDEVCGCLDGTRVQVLQKLKDWTMDHSSKPVFWLSGPVGTGKTAIAKSFCQWFEEEKMLGASFFANREESRRSARSIVRTIAYDLAKSLPELGTPISDAIQRDRAILSRSIRDQIKALVIESLRSMEPSLPVVLVIDGLNDGRGRYGRPAGELIPTFVSSLRKLSSPVKLLLLGSRENGVQELFDECKVERHDLGQYAVQADVRLYYQHAFVDIAQTWHLHAWPSADDLNALVIMSGQLFIFASTVVAYLRSRRHDPVRRLRSFLDFDHGSALGPLDRLYRIILDDAIREDDHDHKDDKGLCERIQKLLAAVVLVAEPLRMVDLALLLNLHLQELRTDLQALSSVIVVPNDSTDSIKIFHHSFADFLSDPLRCTDNRFVMVSDTEHAILACICLSWLSGLEPNICEIEFPGLPNSEVRELDQKLTRHIPRHVQYAIRQWVHHAAETQLPSQTLVDSVAKFVNTGATSWIEACSLLDCLDQVIGNLQSVARWLYNNTHEELGHRLTGIADFIHVHQAPLSASALQVHILGPLFAPSLFPCAPTLREPPTPHLLLPPPIQTPSTRVIRHNIKASVICVAVSPDGAMVAASLKDQLIHLWDMANNTYRILRGHADDVYAIVFSPDGKQLASGSKDKTVRRWDLETYREISTLRKHTQPVLSIAFGPDSRTVISGSIDSKVVIWDDHAYCLENHNRGVTSVVVSPDWLLFATSDLGGTVHLWNMTTFVCRSTLPHPDEIYCMAIAPDSGSLVAGLKDGATYLWDLHTINNRHIFIGHTEAINTIEWPLAPLGTSCFVSASQDRTIRRWDATNGQLIATVRRQAHPVRDMSAFPDGRRFVTGSYGRIHIFNREGRTPETSMDPQAIKFVACSPDSTLVAVCTPDAILQIIDAHTGGVVAIFEGLEPGPTNLTFSSNSQQITMGYGNLSEDTWVAIHDFDRPAVAVHPSRGLVAFSCDDDGWIYYTRLVQGHEVRTRYCWIPPSHRWTDWSKQVAWAGNILAIGTVSGMLSILDFRRV